MHRQLMHAPDTTKRCPNCGSDKLVRVGSQNMKLCVDCPTDIDWKCEKNQESVYGGVKGEMDS